MSVTSSNSDELSCFKISIHDLKQENASFKLVNLKEKEYWAVVCQNS